MRDAPTAVREFGSCVLCDGPDTLDLAVCLDCASRTGDGLVFVRQSIRKVERARVVEHLHGILRAPWKGALSLRVRIPSGSCRSSR